MLRVWDPRANCKVMKLKGHTDNVRCVVLNREGSLVSQLTNRATPYDIIDPTLSSCIVFIG